MYRFSAADFAVYFNQEKLPSKAQWQAVLNAKKLPLVFSEDFDPHTHPICERTQVNHPEGEVVAKIGEATCRYKLDIYDEVHLENLRIQSQRAALQGCDMSFCFRADPANAANSLAVYLSAATLALAADGVIFWGRNRDETRRGPEAFKVLIEKAWRGVRGPGRQFSKQDPFGPPLAPALKSGKRGGFECPRCGTQMSFDLPEAYIRKFYDGEKHTNCGQLIIAPAPVVKTERVTPKKTKKLSLRTRFIFIMLAVLAVSGVSGYREYEKSGQLDQLWYITVGATITLVLIIFVVLAKRK